MANCATVGGAGGGDLGQRGFNNRTMHSLGKMNTFFKLELIFFRKSRFEGV